MLYENRAELRVYGESALFTDPFSKTGGERLTYPVPTYEALRGILEAVYWRPQITWVVDKLRVINPISTFSCGNSSAAYSGGRSLYSQTFLSNPEYRISAHFVTDDNENRHFSGVRRALKKGGSRDIFLGLRCCQGYAEPCGFYDGEGFYDESGEVNLGVMFHSFLYPDKNAQGKFLARLWDAVMLDGVITFLRPDECTIVNDITETENEDESSCISLRSL